MGSASFLFAPDEEERQAAIDPRRSFMVQAPAGSGKTELLIQRFLRLLARVEKPEAIVAITFTRKAAAEMRERVLTALQRVRDREAPQTAHERVTFDLASDALARDKARGWNVLENPGRLRIATIDALCIGIVGQMPWLARMGGVPRIEDDTRALYLEAARRTVLAVEEPGPFAEAMETLLLHQDNNAVRVRDLLAAMLESRDHWTRLTLKTGDEERAELERTLSAVVQAGLEAADKLAPAGVRETWLRLAHYASANLNDKPESKVHGCKDIVAWPGTKQDDLAAWQGLAAVVMKQDGGFRKEPNKSCGFPTTNKLAKQQAHELIGRLRDVPGLETALAALSLLPYGQYSNSQWKLMQSLLACLKLAVAKIREVFREEGMTDFSEISRGAIEALGSVENPTDLAFRLDARIEHLLVDEFQDTSLSQFELLTKLTAGWQPGDGRTLFLVGDPMQSIYRFRQAEVGLFLEAREHGIGDIRLESLQLKANYRSVKSLVDRNNQIFQTIFPVADHMATGAIAYSSSEAADSGGPAEAVMLHPFLENEEGEEAKRVVQLVRAAHAENATDTVAILVRARAHLPAIVAALRREGLRFRALEIDPLDQRPAVSDLLALTRAMLHLGDRVSWLAILRAPWCGLTLTDLHALLGGELYEEIWARLQNLDGLSPDGRMRAERLRAVLAQAFAERGRWPLRRWVERAWTRLGGPWCLQGSGEYQDAMDYLDLLETSQVGSDLADFDGFAGHVNNLFAQADAEAEDWLQVMTIHKAKGLQFDVVILPGLGRPGKRDDSQLFLSHGWTGPDGQWQVLMAPIKESGATEDPAYRYLSEIEKQKSRNEQVRQLYVAATRAKKHLHLMAHAKVENGIAKPAGGSMLKDLWDALTDQERGSFAARVLPAANVSAASASSGLRRLPVDWLAPVPPARVRWEGAAESPVEIHDPSFQWVGDDLRRVGAVVHMFLLRMARGDGSVPGFAALRALLAHAGVRPSTLDENARRAGQALMQTTASARGRWILYPHVEAQSEYAITGLLDGAIVRGVVDRTFLDAAGTRWIIDYKTSTHEGAGLGAFLDEQQCRYRDQLERYAQLLKPLGQPVKVGLYFPLLDEWREWEAGGHGEASVIASA